MAGAASFHNNEKRRGIWGGLGFNSNPPLLALLSLAFSPEISALALVSLPLADTIAINSSTVVYSTLKG